MNNPPMRVTLGAASLKAYVIAPKNLRVLGIVRLGMEYGLLTVDAAGVFFRANGSSVVELDHRGVCEAIDIAHRHGVRCGLGPTQQSLQQSTPRLAPQVITRKHRHVDMAAAAA